MSAKAAKRGEKALRGEQEYLPNYYFEEAEETRWLTGRGEEIMIYDPANVADTTKRYTTVDALEIPKGYVVEVIRAWVKIERTK